MRQSGVLAAPILVGLEEVYEKIEIDHKNAKLLAEGRFLIYYLIVDS